MDEALVRLSVGARDLRCIRAGGVHRHARQPIGRRYDRDLHGVACCASHRHCAHCASGQRPARSSPCRGSLSLLLRSVYRLPRKSSGVSLWRSPIGRARCCRSLFTLSPSWCFRSDHGVPRRLNVAFDTRRQRRACPGAASGAHRNCVLCLCGIRHGPGGALRGLQSCG